MNGPKTRRELVAGIQDASGNTAVRALARGDGTHGPAAGRGAAGLQVRPGRSAPALHERNDAGQAPGALSYSANPVGSAVSAFSVSIEI